MQIQKITFRALAIVLCIFASTLHAQSPTCATHPEDNTAVADTLRSMYTAAMARDLARFDTLLAPGFYAFDDGERFDGDAVMKNVMTYQAKGVVFVWSVTQPDVHVHCDQAWIAYVNKGSIQMNPHSTPIPTTWLEAADLKRIDGSWKLVFFQSTRVPTITH